MKVWFMWDACSLQEVPFHPETVLRFNSTVLFSNRSINREGNSPCRELLLPSCHYQYLHPSRFIGVHFLVFLMAMTQWPPLLRCLKINETQVVDDGGEEGLFCLVSRKSGRVDRRGLCVAWNVTRHVWLWGALMREQLMCFQRKISILSRFHRHCPRWF